jgi:hypothetical protein
MDDAIVVANRLRIAQDASVRYGWPLHVFENCADDPPRVTNRSRSWRRYV